MLEMKQEWKNDVIKPTWRSGGKERKIGRKIQVERWKKGTEM